MSSLSIQCLSSPSKRDSLDEGYDPDETLRVVVDSDRKRVDMEKNIPSFKKMSHTLTSLGNKNNYRDFSTNPGHKMEINMDCVVT